MNNLNKTATLELLLFVAGEEGLELNQLSELSGMSKFACEQQIERLIEKYQGDEESALTIIETAGKYKLATKDSFADILKNYAKTPLNQSLSRSALEDFRLLPINSRLRAWKSINYVVSTLVERSQHCVLMIW